MSQSSSQSPELQLRIERTQHAIETLSFIAVFLTGIVMVLIRTRDPYYRFLLLKQVYEMFGFIKEEPEEGIQAQVLSSFLASSLNIELVYIILAGITRFSSNEGMQQQ